MFSVQFLGKKVMLINIFGSVFKVKKLLVVFANTCLKIFTALCSKQATDVCKHHCTP